MPTRRRAAADEEIGTADEDESKSRDYPGVRRLQRALLVLALVATTVLGLRPTETDTLAAAAARGHQAVASVLADESLWKGLALDGSGGDAQAGDDILDRGAQIKRQEQYYASVVTPLEASKKLEASTKDEARTGLEAAAAVVPTTVNAAVEEDKDANGGWCKDESPHMCTAGKSRCKEPGYRLMHCQRTCGLCEGAAGRERCLSFKHELCPPTDLAADASRAERARRRRDCEATALAEHAIRPPAEAHDTADGLRVGGWCGTRQPRDNPCFVEGGRTHCLPRFFVLGEMKCGTTTLHQLLAKHPRIALPLTKEPRYLAPPRYGTTTLVSYAREFEAAVTRPDSITFDASPVYLAESIEDSRRAVASSWLLRWLPQSRFIVMVRDPVQRAYSHPRHGQSGRLGGAMSGHHPLARPHLKAWAALRTREERPSTSDSSERPWPSSQRPHPSHHLAAPASPPTHTGTTRWGSTSCAPTRRGSCALRPSSRARSRRCRSPTSPG